MQFPPLPSFKQNVLVLAIAYATLACGPAKAKSPAEAQSRLREAANTRDARKLWNALDQDTRWSWMTIQRAWREAYDITLSNLPEGPNRDRLQARFEPGATAENAEQVFLKMVTKEDWIKVSADVSGMGNREPKLDPSETSAAVATPSGPVSFRNAHNRYWGWGYAGLSDQAEDLKRTASTDLENLRKEAADYERAATRGAP